MLSSYKVFLFTFGLLVSSGAKASFDFSPVTATLTPSGTGATFSFQVSNADTTKIPVQISIVAREPDADGKEEYKESEKIDEQFRIFPDHLILDAKETRTVRVTWIGNQRPAAEIAFRIIAEELPIDLDDPNKVYKKPVARVTIATKYVGSLYITPSGSRAEIVAEAKKSEAVGTDLILTVANKGTAHQVIKQPTLKLQGLGSTNQIVLTGDEVKSLVNQNILAGRERRFTLPWPKNLPAGPVKVSLDFAKE